MLAILFDLIFLPRVFENPDSTKIKMKLFTCYNHKFINPQRGHLNRFALLRLNFWYASVHYASEVNVTNKWFQIYTKWFYCIYGRFSLLILLGTLKMVSSKEFSKFSVDQKYWPLSNTYIQKHLPFFLFWLMLLITYQWISLVSTFHFIAMMSEITLFYNCVYNFLSFIIFILCLSFD